MRTKFFKSALKVALLCGAVMALESGVVLSDAHAKGFNRSTSAKGFKGKTAKADHKVKGEKGKGYNRESNVTGPNGKTGKKSVDGKWDKENKTLDRSVTGYNGKQHTTQTKVDKENKSINTTSSNGGSKSTTFDNGTKTTSYTNKNGKTGTKTTTASYDQETGVVTTTRNATGPNGKTGTKTTETSYDKENKSLNRSTTGYNGEERSSTTTYDKENKTVNTDYSNGGSRSAQWEKGKKTTSYTNKDGETGTKETTWTRQND
ncbi:MAG: hypothetical protein WBC26_07780 [Alphaproteobacteria bacterium]|nr:hypothetical protein [Alphaproteobacteria bacterium]MBP7761815.1 hypothetical protein [Alphaproteobacteria bacterium]